MKSEILSHPLVTVHSTRLSKIPPFKRTERELFTLLKSKSGLLSWTMHILNKCLNRVLLHHKKEYKHNIEKQKMPSKTPVSLCPPNL